VEKAFNDFFMGPKQATLLPHTPVQKRQFILGLAEMYRFGTELVDADPHRSVQIRRRIDSRIPTPLLSSTVGAPAVKRQLGGLGDMKKTTAGSSPLLAPNPIRGWGNATLSRPSSPQMLASRMLSNVNLPRSSSQPTNVPVTLPRPAQFLASGSGIHRLDHTAGHYTPPQKRDFEENAKDWDEED
jgi:transcriptional repressor NF-X1